VDQACLVQVALSLLRLIFRKKVTLAMSFFLLVKLPTGLLVMCDYLLAVVAVQGALADESKSLPDQTLKGMAALSPS